MGVIICCRYEGLKAVRASSTSLTVINIRSLFHSELSEGMPFVPIIFFPSSDILFSHVPSPVTVSSDSTIKIDTNTIYPSTLTPYGDRHWVNQFENVTSNVSERLLDQASHKTSIVITTCRRMLVRASAISEVGITYWTEDTLLTAYLNFLQ